MIRLSMLTLILLPLFLLPATTVAQEILDSGEHSGATLPSVASVSLNDLLDAVGKNSKKQFLVNAHVSPSVVVGQPEIERIDYPVLLQILRNNDLAAATVNGFVNVVPVDIIRQYSLPGYREQGGRLDEEEWVTGVIQAENVPAAMLIPIMRPMMPRAGHLAANTASNSIIIVDRLGNARRILSLIRQLDEATIEQAE